MHTFEFLFNLLPTANLIKMPKRFKRTTNNKRNLITLKKIRYGPNMQFYIEIISLR
jgi:hypothetical protein